jgi:hypothetical protein
VIFVELPAFTAQALFDDAALLALQLTLMADPMTGDLIPHGRGLRKLRVALPGRGKRGGARVIYYWYGNEGVCYLVFAYAKSRQSNLTQRQTRVLAEVLREVLKHE